MSRIFRAMTADCPTGYEGTTRTIPPGATMVAPLHAAWSLAESLQASCAAGNPPSARPPRLSAVGHYTRPYCGQDLAGKSLLAWRGCGIGDQLVFAGCLAWLQERYPTARIDLLCDPRIGAALWAGALALPFRLLAEPLPLACWRAYDYHWLAEGLCDGDREPDQPDIWTGHLASIGQSDAPASARLPLVPHSIGWHRAAHQFLSSLPVTSEPLVLWHLAASSTVRSLPPEQTYAALELLHRVRPDVRVIVTGAPPQYEEYKAAFAVPNVIADTSALTLQAVFALVGMVDALVCPDSCLGHVSAACATPTVSLWCPFPARARALGYPNHYPIEATCECAPCWAHEVDSFGNSRQGCPREPAGADSGRWCKGLQAIRPQEIVDRIKEII